MIVGAASASPRTQVAVDEIAAALRPHDPSLVFCFHGSSHAAPEVATALAEALRPATTLGCTTMGELGPDGMMKGGMVALGLRPRAFAVEHIEHLPSFRFEQGAPLVGRLSTGLGRRPHELEASTDLLITLTDGLSDAEDRLASALGLTAPGIPIVGGSAADDGKFDTTWTFVDGRALPSSAIVVALEPEGPFVPFAVHHYEPTAQRVVVTAADPETKRILEIDGKPAVEVYARLAGVDLAEVGRDRTAIQGRPVQFGVQVGAQFFVYSVMAAEGSAVRMAVPVVRGAVLTVARATDILEATRAGLARMRSILPTAAEGALVFNCGGRLFEAERKDIVAQLWTATCSDLQTVGFSTYGEQFGPMLVNHTLTGVLFGAPENRLA